MDIEQMYEAATRGQVSLAEFKVWAYTRDQMSYDVGYEDASQHAAEEQAGADL